MGMLSFRLRATSRMANAIADGQQSTMPASSEIFCKRPTDGRIYCDKVLTCAKPHTRSAANQPGD
jgi:hypothetical protein